MAESGDNITFNQAVVKYAFPAAVAATMLFAGIVGGQVLTKQDRMSDTLAVVQTDVAVMKNDIAYLKERSARELARTGTR